MIEVWPENGHVIVVALKEDNPMTGRRQPATGLTSVIGFLSTTNGEDEEGELAEAIDPALSVELSEYSGTPGTYFGSIPGENFTEQLPEEDYPDRTEIYQIVTYGHDLRVVAKAIVRRVRHA